MFYHSQTNGQNLESKSMYGIPSIHGFQSTLQIGKVDSLS